MTSRCSPQRGRVRCILAWTVAAGLAGACAPWSAGCSLASPSVSAGPGAQTDARTASPDILADKSSDQTAFASRPSVTQGRASNTDIDTATSVTEADQKGVFNASLAIIGGSGAAGITGIGGIALWLRWARKTGEARTNAQTRRIKMLVDLLKEVLRGKQNGGG